MGKRVINELTYIRVEHNSKFAPNLERVENVREKSLVFDVIPVLNYLFFLRVTQI